MGMRLLFSKQARQKALVFMLGCLALLLLAEAGLRIYGFAVARRQMKRNLAAAAAANSVRILCIGESMTYQGYPAVLQKVLDSAATGIKFEVVDAALVGANSSATLASLEKDLDRYPTQLVIAMLGCNDRTPERIMLTPLYDSLWGRLLRELRIYRFIHYLYELSLKNSIPEQTIKRATAAPQTGRARKWWAALLARSSAGLNDKRWSITTPADAMDNKDFALAVRLLRQQLADTPDDVGLWMQLGDAYIRDNKLQEGEAALIKALQLAPKYYEALCRLADTYIEKSKHPEKAGELLDRALALQPDDVFLYYARARMYLRAGKTNKAEAEIKQGLRITPKEYMLWIMLGNIQRDLGRIDDSMSSFRKAMALDATNGQSYAGIGEIYAIHKKDRAAFQVVARRMLKTKIRTPQACAYMGAFASDMNMRKLAEQLFEKALAINPLDVETNMTCGTYYLSTIGDAQKAKHFFLTVLKVEPDNPAARGGVLLAQERLGLKPDEAIASPRYSPPKILIENYRSIKSILDKRGIPLVAMQYPMRELKTLMDIFPENDGILFISNENFAPLVREHGYARYFNDMFAGDFGHCTPEGNRLVAENAAQTILREFAPPRIASRRSTSF